MKIKGNIKLKQEKTEENKMYVRKLSGINPLKIRVKGLVFELFNKLIVV
jgi:hypothetical protein